MQRSKPSESALSIAIQLLLLDEDKQWGHLVPKEVVEATSRFVYGTHHPITHLLTYTGFRYLLRHWSNWVLPFFSVHVALRKKWIEAKTKKALQQGMKQVVVIGAGFDTLAYRLHRLDPDVEWIEIDLPHTQAHKIHAIRGLVEQNLQFLPADLSHEALDEVLLHHTRYQFNQPTLFIAEGVLMYLHEFEVKNLLQTISYCSDRGSVLIGSALKPQINGRLDLEGTRWLIRSLSQRDEPYRWGITTHHLQHFLANHSFNLITTQDSHEIAPSELHTKLPKGEYFFLAING